MRNVFNAGSIDYLGKWKGGWALEIESFSGQVKWHQTVFLPFPDDNLDSYIFLVVQDHFFMLNSHILDVSIFW